MYEEKVLKKVLIVASVVSFIEWFNKENISFLKNNMNCEVHIACNFDYMDDTDIIRTKEYIEKIKIQGIILHNIAFVRNPINLNNIKAYRELKKIVYDEKFDLIHCHTPTVSMMVRIAAQGMRKKGTVVMYTCHGFHFHNSSSKMNWVLYYPVEKILSRFCDYIVTINKEDYHRAKKFHCQNVRYIPGVGIDINAIRNIVVEKNKKRASVGIPNDKILIISVGELISRKNHEVIIRALAQIDNSDIYYAIAGKGPLKEYLAELAEKLGIKNQVIFLGFRTDVYELYHVADMSAFPSKIEGLGLAGIEALASGIPVISSNVHGIRDYMIDGETGYMVEPENVNGYAEAIKRLVDHPEIRSDMKSACFRAAEPFELSNALNVMWNIYKEILGEC